MRKKNKLWTTSLTLMLIVGIIMVGLTSVIPVYAQAPTVKLIDTDTGLSTIPDGTYGIGDKFNVTIMVLDVIDMGGWKVSITYDSSVVDYTGPQAAPPAWPVGARIWEGAWFLAYALATGPRGTTWNTFGPSSTLAGEIANLGDAFMPMPPGINGTGDVATIEFEVVGYATAPGTTIGFSLVDLKDSLNVPITPVSTVDLTFINEPPPPYGPTVDFTYSPVVVWENDIVTFTATTTDGFNGTDFCPVTEYRWDFNGTGIDLTTGVPTADFNYTTAGTYQPFVEVYAPNTAGSEYETANKSKPLTVFAAALSGIDVYTELAGSGPNLYGSAFEPGQEVTISADLIYNGVPVNNVWVSFQIVDVSGDNVTFRTAITAGGTATVKVRLPLIGSIHLTSESDFGTFKCIATANVFEEPFDDTVSFYVGWIVDTVSVAATDAARGAPSTVTVNIENYALETKPVFLTVTVYDSVGVAVGVYSTGFTISAASFVGLGVTPYLQIEGATITIPLDAWPGPAYVYVNAFDKPPLAGGDAWCSEISTTFAIT